jgi:hypothetical protein
MLTTLQRLKLSRELATVTAALPSTSDLQQRFVFEQRANSLRAILAGRREGSVGDLDLFAVESSAAAVMQQLDAAENADPSDKRAAGEYAFIIAEKLGAIARQLNVVSYEASNASGDLMRRATQFTSSVRDEEFQDAMKERFRQAGVEELVAMVTKLNAARGEVAKVEERYAAYREEREEAWREVEAKIAGLQAIRRDRFDAMLSGEISKEEYEVHAQDFQREYSRLVKEDRDTFDPRNDELIEAHRAAQKVMAEAADTLKQDLLAKSPVTQEQAQAWAEAQQVDPSAKAALKRIGYELPKLRADVAEFYRLTGGRLAKVRIKASRGRASASDIHGYRNRTINMGSGFSKRTLFHELGHHLEADPAVYAAAAGFLKAKRESPKLYKLRELSGGVNYKPKEVAYRDSWYHVYVGKVYPYKVTEVISMGMEAFADGATMAAVMQKDDEHIRLMNGFMRTPPSELFGTVKQVFKQAADAEDEIADVKETAIESAMSRLASGVEFDKAEQPPTEQTPYFYGGKGVLLGTYHGLQVWQVDKVRDPQTGRKKKGFVLAHGEPRETTNWRGERVTQWGFTTAKAFTMEEAKAMARVWARTANFALPSDPRILEQYADAWGS